MIDVGASWSGQVHGQSSRQRAINGVVLTTTGRPTHAHRADIEWHRRQTQSATLRGPEWQTSFQSPLGVVLYPAASGQAGRAYPRFTGHPADRWDTPFFFVEQRTCWHPQSPVPADLTPVWHPTSAVRRNCVCHRAHCPTRRKISCFRKFFRKFQKFRKNPDFRPPEFFFVLVQMAQIVLFRHVKPVARPIQSEKSRNFGEIRVEPIHTLINHPGSTRFLGCFWLYGPRLRAGGVRRLRG